MPLRIAKYTLLPLLSHVLAGIIQCYIATTGCGAHPMGKQLSPPPVLNKFWKGRSVARDSAHPWAMWDFEEATGEVSKQNSAFWIRCYCWNKEKRSGGSWISVGRASAGAVGGTKTNSSVFLLMPLTSRPGRALLLFELFLFQFGSSPVQPVFCALIVRYTGKEQPGSHPILFPKSRNITQVYCQPAS